MNVQQWKLEPAVDALPFTRPMDHEVHLEVGLVGRLVSTDGAMIKSSRVGHERNVHLNAVKDDRRTAGGGRAVSGRSVSCPTIDKNE